ncbi:ATP-NAD kinase-like domain-containing protein [Tuber borchii]|uniref:ATP-NAD kinase-like domain-containing protein n=1 Tax=Tuber borchii TaxID=42251 RepID=A0A2T6ZJW2_TUBBO|nr:ATP-NAD kinase-like domain-containing protein [Tuber borchii]
MATIQFNIPTIDEGLVLDTEQVASNPLTDAEETDDHVLQITFDPHVQSARRRKSSVVSVDGMGNPLLPRLINSHNNSSDDKGECASTQSSCFVHALLEMQNQFVPVGGGKVSGREMDGKKEKERAVAEHMNPPFMTKSELSDMVLGVRELSKHLASIQIKMKVRAIMILTKTYDRALIGYTRKLVEWLMEGEKGSKYTVYVEDTLKDAPEFDAEGLEQKCPGYKSRLHYWSAELCAKRPHSFDFVITLGGDGTVLYASWLFQKVVPPVFSFSLGSLGFLTKFDFCAFEEVLSTAIQDGVTVGLRLRFEGVIMRRIKGSKDINTNGDIADEIFSGAALRPPTHTPGEAFVVLNEIVVDRGPNPTMSSTELYGDDMHLTTIQADGVCIATPTGSTAYSLAAGGSLCHPEIPAILISPICAHTLTFRPLVLPDSMVVRVAVPCDARTTAWVSFDGRQRIELNQGDYVMISASRFPFPAVQSKPDNKDWIDSIRRTMNWGSRPRQQAFS